MITTSLGILAYSEVQIYLELYDFVDGMTEKLVNVVGFRRACIHCQGENRRSSAHCLPSSHLNPSKWSWIWISRVLSIISSFAASHSMMSTYPIVPPSNGRIICRRVAAVGVRSGLNGQVWRQTTKEPPCTLNLPSAHFGCTNVLGYPYPDVSWLT